MATKTLTAKGKRALKTAKTVESFEAEAPLMDRAQRNADNALELREDIDEMYRALVVILEAEARAEENLAEAAIKMEMIRSIIFEGYIK